MRKLISFLLMAIMVSSCANTELNNEAAYISKDIVNKVVDELSPKATNLDLLRRGVTQTASLWRSVDGTPEQFEAFCKEYYIADEALRQQLFERFSSHLETIRGYMNEIDLDLKAPSQLNGYPDTPIDDLMAGYDVSSHIVEDFFNTKIAFICKLNFPSFSLQEKNELGSKWTRLEWAYARMGDMYNSRIPSDLLLEYSEVMNTSATYISDYNIEMGSLRTEDGRTLFPQGMSLLSHWNLRDEIKSNYSDKVDGLEKQRMIYEIMNRIIDQTIPQCVINNPDYLWYPNSNKVIKDGKEIEVVSEPNTRYSMLLNGFKTILKLDKYYTTDTTYIQRAFDGQMEFSYQEIEEMYTKLVSSKEVGMVAEIIKKNLGRDLEPFDVWYDGFKSLSDVSANDLDVITKAKYPNSKAFEADMPRILQDLGFTKEKAEFISSKIVTEPARGSGHAWGSQMKSAPSHLRTRIAPDGMDYKGYNIAVHEFGHNVEQTISLQDVDYYILNGVPNTAFTEGLAFIFQMRDLELLGLKKNDKTDINTILDIFWNAYEIMGVSLVEMNVWKWLYAHPDVSPAELKQEIINIAKDIWNKYYAPHLGEQDSPILAIYSHMIDSPLYLPNYPLGYIIEFQLEQYYKGRNLADETLKFFKQGCLVPQSWMLGAVGEHVSVEPLIKATSEALNTIE